ncbi:MAG: hypothetical protein GXP35_14215 [Actinobacteria bacterium]|nr:hypothetical protein [Actinomycetota bacterium]
MFESTKSRFGPPPIGPQNPLSRRQVLPPTWRRWLPVAAILAIAAISQARTPQVAVAEQVQPAPTTLAPHLRTVAIAIPRNERPPLVPDDLVDVYSVDVFTGSPVLVVDGGRVVAVDDSRIVIAVPGSAAAAIAVAAASRTFTVVGR